MTKNFLLLLCLVIHHTGYGMHYVKNLFSTTENRPTSQDDQEIQEIKFIYLGQDPDIKQITFQLITAAKDPSIKGVILLINNNGGSMSNYSMLHDTIKKMRSFKPVVAVVIRAFSAGYIVASAADYIIAHRCAEVGSIGVILEIKHFKNPLIQQDGIETQFTSTLFKGGEFKDIYHAYGRGELSEKEITYLQQNVEISYNEIVSLIAENRSLSINNAEAWANAKTFIAHTALDLGLIDQIGTLFEAEEKIMELLSRKAYKPYTRNPIKYSFCENEDEC